MLITRDKGNDLTDSFVDGALLCLLEHTVLDQTDVFAWCFSQHWQLRLEIHRSWLVRRYFRK